MKTLIRNRKNLILLILSVAILGALISREYPLAGLIVTLAGVGFYLIANLRVLRLIPRLREIAPRRRVRVIIFLILVYIFTEAIITRSVSYFLLLILLAVEYLLYEELPDQTQS